MRRQLIHAILLLWLTCSSGWAQDIDIFARAPLFYLEPWHNNFGGDTALNAGLRGKCGPTSVPVTKELAIVCSTALSTSDLIAWSYAGPRSHQVPIGRFSNGQSFFFVSGMTIDADGAPNAYHPDDIGLDEVANAGEPGKWNGIITDQDGTPLIQQQNDPFPGYYVSCTSLFDNTKMFTDPTTYVDASRIPYIALPKELAEGERMRLGDFALVVNLENGKSSYAIYADFGTIGEGSIALANALGISADARDGGQSDGVLYLFFPGSGNQRPRDIAEIQIEGEKQLSITGRLSETLIPARTGTIH